MDPFDALVNIARRSRKAAGALPEKEAQQSLWSGFGFGLFGERFVVDLAEVAELMRMPTYTALPDVKPWVAGVANVRGRLLTVIDLALLFGQGSSVPRNQRRVLVVDRDEDYFGFVVDESLGMLHFPGDAQEEEPGEVDGGYRPFISGSFQVAGTSWPVFSLLALLQDERLMDLAEEARVTH